MNIQLESKESVFSSISLLNDTDKYILLAGLDYPGHANGFKLTGDFISYVTKRKNEIIAGNKSSTIEITTISLLQGKIIKETIVNGKIDSTDTKDYDPITFSKNYPGLNRTPPNHMFEFNGSNPIKKQDIYKLIEDIGTASPNTLKEFSIYSHAYYDGPILVNSNGNDIANDNDFRRDDVTAINSSFGEAFAADGKVVVWGCSFPRILNLLFSRFRKNSKYTLSPIDDAEIFSYPANHFQQQELINSINKLLGTIYELNKKIDISFLQIKKIAVDQFLRTYAAKFAEEFTIKVVGALPATYANITPNFHISPDVMANVNFYKNHLGVSLDNNYDIYDMAIINNLKTNVYNK